MKLFVWIVSVRFIDLSKTHSQPFLSFLPSQAGSECQRTTEPYPHLLGTNWSFPKNLQDLTCPPSQESKAFNQKMDEPLILSASPPWMLASKPWRADELAVIILYHTILCRHHVIFGCLGEDRVGGRDQLSQTLISPPPYYAASTRKSSLDHDMLHQDILHQGGRSWQAFGERKKCLQFFRRTRIC